MFSNNSKKVDVDNVDNENIGKLINLTNLDLDL